MLEKTIQRRATITYRVSIVEEFDETYVDADGRRVHATGSRVVGYRVMECPIDIEVDLEAIARDLGPRACRSKGGKSVDGHVKVTRAGTPKELRQESTPPTFTRRGETPADE